MAELADALDLGSSGGDPVEVQALSSAPNKTKDLTLLFSFFIGTRLCHYLCYHFLMPP